MVNTRARRTRPVVVNIQSEEPPKKKAKTWHPKRARISDSDSDAELRFIESSLSPIPEERSEQVRFFQRDDTPSKAEGSGTVAPATPVKKVLVAAKRGPVRVTKTAVELLKAEVSSSEEEALAPAPAPVKPAPRPRKKRAKAQHAAWQTKKKRKAAPRSSRDRQRSSRPRKPSADTTGWVRRSTRQRTAQASDIYVFPSSSSGSPSSSVAPSVASSSPPSSPPPVVVQTRAWTSSDLPPPSSSPSPRPSSPLSLPPTEEDDIPPVVSAPVKSTTENDSSASQAVGNKVVPASIAEGSTTFGRGLTPPRPVVPVRPVGSLTPPLPPVFPQAENKITFILPIDFSPATLEYELIDKEEKAPMEQADQSPHSGTADPPAREEVARRPVRTDGEVSEVDRRRAEATSSSTPVPLALSGGTGLQSSVTTCCACGHQRNSAAEIPVEQEQPAASSPPVEMAAQLVSYPSSSAEEVSEAITTEPMDTNVATETSPSPATNGHAFSPSASESRADYITPPTVGTPTSPPPRPQKTPKPPRSQAPSSPIGAGSGSPPQLSISEDGQRGPRQRLDLRHAAEPAEESTRVNGDELISLIPVLAAAAAATSQMAMLASAFLPADIAAPPAATEAPASSTSSAAPIQSATPNLDLLAETAGMVQTIRHLAADNHVLPPSQPWRSTRPRTMTPKAVELAAALEAAEAEKAEKAAATLVSMKSHLSRNKRASPEEPPVKAPRIPRAKSAAPKKPRAKRVPKAAADGAPKARSRSRK